MTAAITNDPSSPLAAAADHVVDLGAGEEHSVAATKTYTASLAAIAALVAEGDPRLTGEVVRLPRRSLPSWRSRRRGAPFRPPATGTA